MLCPPRPMAFETSSGLKYTCAVIFSSFSFTLVTLAGLNALVTISCGLAVQLMTSIFSLPSSRTIPRELGNENIDVINWTANPQLMVTRALSPARVTSVKLNDENMTAQVYLRPEEVSKAIGRGGHNIRLAGQLTGYEIDVFREGVEEDVELTEFRDEIDAWIIEEFKKIGLDTARSIIEQDVDDLVKRTDLEEETIIEVVRILKEELED